MGIISKIREWISRMLSKSDIKGVYGIDIAVTDSMIRAIDKWDRMYAGKAAPKGVHSLRLEHAVVREFANTAINEMALKVSNDKLDAIMKNVLENLNKNLQRGLATGAMIIKPLGADKVQYVPQSQFIPVEYDVNGRLIKVIFPEIKRMGDNDYRIRLEYHALDHEKGLTITNRAFRSNDGVSLGAEIPLTAVSEWAELIPKIAYPLMLRPSFGYYVNPIDNTVDGSHSGASVFAGAEEVIRKADIQFGRLDWEFESGERAIDVDEAVLRPVTDPFTGKKRAEMPKLNERLFRGVNVSAMVTT